MDPIAIVTGIKTAIDLAKTINSLSTDIEIKSKTADLYNVILSLQGDISSITADNYSLLQQNNSLSSKLVELETWEKEKTNYSLTEISPKVFVYSRNATDENTEPLHWICANCYQKRIKSILQLQNTNPYTGDDYICHECSSKICDRSKVVKRHVNRPPPNWRTI